MLLARVQTHADVDRDVSLSPPTIVLRTHASGVTACAVVRLGERVFVLTAGNDQWVRVWGVCGGGEDVDGVEDGMLVERLGRTRTSVADVSSMGVLVGEGADVVRVVICGVGVEVVRVEMSVA